MKTLETLKQQLFNGLNSANYEKYVDLVNENLQGILRDNDYAWELYFVENNNETLWDTVESMMADWGAQNFINYIQNSEFDPYEDFMAYNSFETKSYEELRDLYVEKLFSDYYADILTELVLLEEVSFELEEEPLGNKLLNGLKGRDFRKYVDLVRESLNNYLDNYNELCWFPNNEESLRMIMEGLGWTAYDLLSFSAHYNFKDNFVRVNVYGNLESISYVGLADLYVKELFSGDYALLIQVVNDKADELEEL